MAQYLQNKKNRKTEVLLEGVEVLSNICNQLCEYESFVRTAPCSPIWKSQIFRSMFLIHEELHGHKEFFELNIRWFSLTNEEKYLIIFKETKNEIIEEQNGITKIICDYLNVEVIDNNNNEI